MTKTSHLTIVQQIILNHNTHLWPASILDDGACLCLDRESKVNQGLDRIDDVDHRTYVLAKDGAIRSTYHHYVLRSGFTFVEAGQQPKPDPPSTPLDSREVLTVDETVAYVLRKYGVQRTRTTISYWIRRGRLSAHQETRAKHRVWLINRCLLDREFLAGRLPLQPLRESP